MTVIEISQKAPVGEIFEPGCFDSSVGEQIPLRIDDDRTLFTCKLLEARVQEGGASVNLVLEVEDGIVPFLSDLIYHRVPISFVKAGDDEPTQRS